MKKYSLTSIFGIIGMILWSATILLRETQVSTINFINFLLGIMPNFAAVWTFIWAGEVILGRKKIEFTFKISSITSVVVLGLAIISEIIHDIFLNSPFDFYDIIATILSIVLYLVIFYYFKNIKKVKLKN